jgi:putative drug exporter of the RND superfamily
VLAALGRFCFHHRRLVLVGWLVAFVVGLGVGVQVFPRLRTDYSGTTIESFQGFDIMSDSAQYGSRISAVVEGAGKADRGDLTAAASDLRQIPGVARVIDPITAPPEAGLVAADGKAVLFLVDLKNLKDLNSDGADRALDQVEKRFHTLGEDTGAEVILGGDLLLQRESAQQSQQDTERGEAVALPITLLVMVFLFGGFVAAGIPLLGAFCSIAGGLAALFGFSFLLPLDPSVPSVTTVLGLGLSIDYALLMVQRYREERGLGRDAEQAVLVAVSTAGRTISFSALTVATALTGLFVFQLSIFRALGAAGVTVVLVALAVGLTLVPALLATFHHRIKVPTERVSDDGFFARLARATQRRAALVTIGLAAVLLAAGAPFLGVHFQNGGADLLPTNFEARRFAEAIATHFPNDAVDPVYVVAHVPAAQLQTYAENVITNLPDVRRLQRATDRQHGWSLVEVTPYGSSQGDRAKALVRELRDHRPAFRTWVTGSAPVLVDFQDLVRAGLPWAALILGAGTFVLLFLMTGSVLVPLKALVMNTLSLGATFGVLVLVFQDGHGAGLLGFTPTGALETWVPVVVFAFAFGLSMDYEVFLLSRVKELYDSGMSNDKAIEVGLQRSGRIITSAALLVFIVFLGFTAGKLLGIKQLGLALATAVAVDATIVRCLLVPATMTLLGDRNWWAPPWLRRLHNRIGLREHVVVPLPDADDVLWTRAHQTRRTTGVSESTKEP